MHQTGCEGLRLVRDFTFSFPLQSLDLGHNDYVYVLAWCCQYCFYFRPFKIMHTYTCLCKNEMFSFLA